MAAKIYYEQDAPIDGLQGKKYFIETLFNPWNVAEKMSSPEEVLRLKKEEPQLLLDALEAIAASQVHHVKKAVEAGAAGIFLAIANAQEELLSESDYEQFSEPFDRMVLQAVAEAPLNTLHLHGEGVYLERFFSGWPAAVIQYSTHRTGVPIEKVRAEYGGVLMGGIDEGAFRDLMKTELKQQWQAAQSAAGKKFILAPGCSVPDETTDEELMRLVELMHI
jgi:uroporphyrinogen-III decarboxylase